MLPTFLDTTNYGYKIPVNNIVEPVKTHHTNGFKKGPIAKNLLEKSSPTI